MKGKKMNSNWMNSSRRIAVVDIESTNWIDFVVLGFFDGEDYMTFTSIRRFLLYLDRREYNGLTIYAHNGGKFDFLFFLDFLFRNEWVERVIDKSGRIIALKCEGVNASFMFADSYSLLQSSLRKLGEAFNTPHQKTTIDYKRVKKDDERTLKYLFNDVMCLYECLCSFFNSEWIATPKLTIASQAMNTFKEFFMPYTLQRIKFTDSEAFRAKYYAGGRVEVFKGAGTVNCYDVNSLFPFAMLQPMPCGVMKKTQTYRHGCIGFYECNVGSTPDWYVSPLMFKGKKEGDRNPKTFFVNGSGTYYLSSAMIELLRSDYGIKVTVNSGWYFTSQEDLFTEYVTKFFKLKQEGTGANKVIAKYMLNSLYGKFGQAQWAEALVHNDGYREGFRDANPYLTKYGMVLIKEKSRSKFIMPFIAAYITELARLYHFQLMRKHEAEMVYCDTDSLYTFADYSSNVGERIGQLKFEGRFRGIFLNAKSYALKWGKKEKVAFKGFSTDTFKFRHFERALEGRALVQRKERVLGYRECLKRVNDIVRRHGKFLVLVNQKKTNEHEYDKRQVFPSRDFVFETMPYDRAEMVESDLPLDNGAHLL